MRSGGADDRESTPSITFIVPIPMSSAGPALATVGSLDGLDAGSWNVVLVCQGLAPGGLNSHGNVTVREVDESAPLAFAIDVALESATGEFIAILTPGSAIEPTAVTHLMAACGPTTDIVYSDERIGSAVFAKPAFSPERLRTQFYFGDITAYRLGLVRDIGGMRSGFEGAELYDLALRASRRARHVAQVREVLSSGDGRSSSSRWGNTDSHEDQSIARVLSEHLEATGGGTVDSVGADGVNRTRRHVQGEPLVSIVIPTRGDSATIRGTERCLVVEAVRGIVERSTYRNFEVVVVVDTVAPAGVREQLLAIGGGSLRLVEWDDPFSFSAKMNMGALHSRGEFLLMLNDDVEVITPAWIEPMLALAQRPGAGFVGAMLYFEDDTIQHAGHAYYRGDVTHIGLNSERGARGPWGAFEVEREVAGVTGACALIRASVFIEAGGFSPLLPGNFNDVDLCMKLAALGYQSYWTPLAELYHFESKSRDPRVARSEIQTAWGRWEQQFWDSPWWPTDPHEIYLAKTKWAS